MTIIEGTTFGNSVADTMSIQEAAVTVENVHIEHPVNINQVDVDVQYITVPSVFLLLLFLHSIHFNSINFFKISKVCKRNCCGVIISDFIELTPIDLINEKGERETMFVEKIVPKVPGQDIPTAGTTVIRDGGVPGQDVPAATSVVSTTVTQVPVVSTAEVTGEVVRDDSSPGPDVTIQAPVMSTAEVDGEVMRDDSSPSPDVTIQAPVMSTAEVTGEVVRDDSGPSPDVTIQAPVVSTAEVDGEVVSDDNIPTAADSAVSPTQNKKLCTPPCSEKEVAGEVIDTGIGDSHVGPTQCCYI